MFRLNLKEFTMFRFLLAVLMAATAYAGAAKAQSFPTHPVTLQVAFTAGGPTDRHLRVLASLAAKHLGQPIVVENRPGAGGALAASSLALSGKANGYTIAQAPMSVFRMPYMEKMNWDPIRDFTWIIGLSGYTFGIAVRADSEFKTWADVVRYGRANPERLTYGTPGVGTSTHLLMEDLAQRAGIKVTHVPYKGGAEAERALLAGEVMLNANAISAYIGQIEAGKFRVLMLWDAERNAFLPQVPTARELGYDIVYLSPYGLVGPKGMPADVVRTLHDAFKKAMDDPEHAKVLQSIRQTAWYRSPEDYAKFAREAYQSERVLVERAGLLAK